MVHGQENIKLKNVLFKQDE